MPDQHPPGAGHPGAPRERPQAESPRVVEPLDPPMVPFAVAGTVCWAVAGLVLLLFFRGWLEDHGRTDWLWTCLAGFLLGFLGLAVMTRHDRNRRARR